MIHLSHSPAEEKVMKFDDCRGRCLNGEKGVLESSGRDDLVPAFFYLRGFLWYIPRKPSSNGLLKKLLLNLHFMFSQTKEWLWVYISFKWYHSQVPSSLLKMSHIFRILCTSQVPIKPQKDYREFLQYQLSTFPSLLQDNSWTNFNIRVYYSYVN